MEGNAIEISVPSLQDGEGIQDKTESPLDRKSKLDSCSVFAYVQV